MTYIYLGDRFTDVKYKKQRCEAVRRKDGKCIRGRNGNMLVKFDNGETVNIIGKITKKNKSMKNSGKILKRKDGSFLLIPQTQEIPERIIFFIIDENYTKLKNKLGQYRMLVKNFDDAKEIFKESKLIGYQD